MPNIYEISRPEFICKHSIHDDDNKRSYSNIVGNNDAILDEFILQPNVKYYDNHEFHKLSKNVH